jgi:hypothetical protein
MIIPPPHDDDDDYDYYEIDGDSGRPADDNTERFERIKAHMALPPWMCPICNCKNAFGNQRCVYCWVRNSVITDKPK